MGVWHMKLGVLDLVPVLGQADVGTALNQAVRLAQTAERLGYSRYWVPEHHDMERLASAHPEVLLAHIGARTQSIRIGSGAVLLPHYQPLKVAEAFHLLAALYPGRIDLGLGRAPGGSAHVTMALSGNFLQHVQHMPELLRDLMKLLADEYQYEGVKVTARPLPSVAPEVWLLGTNEKSARYAAEYGTGYVFGQFMSDKDGTETIDAYRKAFVPSALRQKPQAIVAVSVVCAQTEEEARRLAAEGKRNGGESADVKPGGAGTDSPVSRDNRLIGTPDQVRDSLASLKEKYDTDEFLIVSHINDYEKRLRSYELLAEFVRD